MEVYMEDNLSAQVPEANVSRAVNTSKMEKKTTKVVNSVEEQPIKFVLIPIGGGGAKIATQMKDFLPGNPIILAMNTSHQDLMMLNLPDGQKFKIGGANVNGAGKDRNKAKSFYKNFAASGKSTNDKVYDALATFIMLYEEVLFDPNKQTIIIVISSDDGGSGSGICPMFTTKLTNYMNTVSEFVIGNKKYQIDDQLNTVPRPVVLGLIPKCDVNEGAQSLQNAIENKKEIQSAIDAKIGTWLMADNNLPENIKYDSIEEKYDIINNRIIAPLVKFLGIELNSSLKCLDLQDKINALRIPGAVSFLSIPENHFQYVIPRGQSVGRIITMIKHDENTASEEKLVKDMLQSYDISSLDSISAYYEIDKTRLEKMNSVSKTILETSMVCMFGYRSLSSIVEDLRNNLRTALSANDKKENVIRNSSTGFSTIANDSKNLSDRFGASAAVNQSDIDDMF